MDPILEIVTTDGRRFRAGQMFVMGYDGAAAEARKLHGLKDGEFTIERIGWQRSNAGLSGCGDWSTPA